MNCPFCYRQIANSPGLPTSPSDDHIFPQFLNGRGTIVSCVECNSTSGHTIEASVDNNILPVFYMLHMSGLSLPKLPRTWRKGHTVGTTTYNITAKESGTSFTPPRISLQRDQTGDIKGGTFLDDVEYQKFLRDFQNRHPTAEFDIHFIPPPKNIATNVPIPLAMDSNLLRLGIKMGISLAVKFGVEENLNSGVLRSEVSSEPILPDVMFAFYDDALFGSLHVPLRHLIYVEANERVTYSVTRLFGVIEIYALLSF